MSTVRVKANYYEQFDADYDLEFPAEGMGGWKQGEIPLALDKTALVVMHAWDIGEIDTYSGWWRACEEVPRTYEVCRVVFPRLLATARVSKLEVFHVVAGGDYFKSYPGYLRAAELAGPEPDPLPRIDRDPVLKELNQFRSDNVWVGARNQADVRRGSPRRRFAKEAIPVGEEGVAENGHQLFALCRDVGVNHLIYAGFDLNLCLTSSPGGMHDMQKYGLMCSVIKEATIACENKETARKELCKEIGLWYVALMFGFVFDLDDLLRAI